MFGSARVLTGAEAGTQKRKRLIRAATPAAQPATNATPKTRRCHEQNNKPKGHMKQGDDINYDFTHVSAGNGWAIVQELGDNFYKVAPITKDGIGQTAFLVWGKRMDRTKEPVEHGNINSPMRDVPLRDAALEKAVEMRQLLKAGKMKIVNQRIVPA